MTSLDFLQAASNHLVANSKAAVSVFRHRNLGFVRGQVLQINMVLGAGRTMKYPYTVTGKLALFPYQWHWQNGRFVRFLGFTLLGVFPLIIKIHRTVHAPGNVQQWEAIRKKREHTHFDPVH